LGLGSPGAFWLESEEKQILELDRAAGRRGWFGSGEADASQRETNPSRGNRGSIFDAC
jgi:hypothetical protein